MKHPENSGKIQARQVTLKKNPRSSRFESGALIQRDAAFRAIRQKPPRINAPNCSW